ncbi:hypothetical protein AB6A40_007829 [Gnathostoma spinigerum]|uniref:Uncharacterized protein n=1 Tax=Gnathostoma spinigerum TaxID=75299 RepID=A0ABD6EXZ7_9BILA
MVQNWNSPERSDQLSQIVTLLRRLEIDDIERKELDFDISLMEEIMKKNEDRRKLDLTALGAYIFQRIFYSA